MECVFRKHCEFEEKGVKPAPNMQILLIKVLYSGQIRSTHMIYENLNEL